MKIIHAIFWIIAFTLPVVLLQYYGMTYKIGGVWLLLIYFISPGMLAYHIYQIIKSKEHNQFITLGITIATIAILYFAINYIGEKNKGELVFNATSVNAMSTQQFDIRTKDGKYFIELDNSVAGIGEVHRGEIMPLNDSTIFISIPQGLTDTVVYSSDEKMVYFRSNDNFIPVTMNRYFKQ
jgi:hypothetical protein